MHNYSEVYSHLNFETAAIVFLKKDGTVRLMLGTRNLSTINLRYGYQGATLGGHDKRCNIGNGNVAVFDLLLGEARAFNIDRLQSIYYMGTVETPEQLDKVANEFIEFQKAYEESKPKAIDMDMLD